MARVGIFGGTFDPPHNGHLALCLFARELLGLDRVIISVSNNPFKEGCGADDAQRLRMAALLADEANAAGGGFDLLDWELRQPGPSYTIRLVEHLCSTLPGSELVLLVGEDSYRQFDAWREPERLFSMCRVVVFKRGSEEPEAAPRSRGQCDFVDFDFPLSSTLIREQLREGQPITGMVPSSIEAYIGREGLYGRS